MTGQRLGHYTILDKLGEGGMGVVYKARDERLDRFVAIKVLPPDKLSNPDRKLRFVQEAKAASALNHPNIITIHEIGDADGVDFIVMEFVDGRTLDRIIPHAGMKIADALKCAIPVADALARAHAAGIVHRDLKPGNIIVSQTGEVKLLDFGLAKLTGIEPSGPEDATRTERALTEAGTIVGTAAYMSPEQAEGRKVDARSDIFSFGAVLYEMVTGQRAFQGASRISTLAAILHNDPKPASEVSGGVPRELDRIVRRCLQKDPAWRFQSAADVKISLHEVLQDIGSSSHVAVPIKSTGKPTWPARVAVAILALAIGALGAGYWTSRQAPRPSPPTVRPLTSYSGLEYDPALSPDGNQIAFSWNGDKKDNFDIYVRLVDGGGTLRLTTDPAADRSPAWSPDGKQIAFERVSGGKATIYLIPALGGVERKLAEFYGIADFLGWSPDGRSIVYSGSDQPGVPAIWSASLDTGEKKQMTKLPAGYRSDQSPSISPDGSTLAFVRARDMFSRAVLFQDLDRAGVPTGRPREMTSYERNIQQVVWLPKGDSLLLVLAERGAQPLWLLKPGNAPEPLGIENGAIQSASLSRTGRLAYARAYSDTNIYRMDGPGQEGGPRPFEKCNVKSLIDSTAADREPMLSPDGKRLAFNSERWGPTEIHVANADGTGQVALTSMGPNNVGSPRWSPDGQTIVFDRYEHGHSMIYTVRAEGGKPQPVTNDSRISDNRPSWSRDGKWIYFGSNRTGSLEIWKIPAGGGTAVQVTRNSGVQAFESSTGNELYYQNAEGIWSMPAAGGEAKRIVSGDSVAGSHWAVAGRSLYYCGLRPASISVVRLDTGKRFEYVRFPAEFLAFASGTSISVSADERTIVYAQEDRRESDLMLVDHLQ